MRMDCKVELKLHAERVDAGTVKVSVFLNGDGCFAWRIPLEKFQTEKVLTVQEVI